MNDLLHFTVPGKPVGKERPRFSKYNDKVYTPNKTKNFENQVGFYASHVMLKNGVKITKSAVGVNVIINHKIPSSYSAKKRADAIAGISRPIKTPDTDNVLKSVMDGMESIVYENDKQVVRNVVDRFYAEEWSIEVEFYEI